MRPGSTGSEGVMTRRLLICSIGNPGAAYRHTRHSAGHLMSELLQEVLGFPESSTDRRLGGLVSRSFYNPTYTFFQSPSLMNISGKPIRQAWRAFQAELSPEERVGATLVVLHDELQQELGKAKLKSTGSPSGHNGLISCIEHLETKEFYRLGIGIGRPESRDSRDVSKYVLGKFTSFEKQRLETKSLDRALSLLEQLAKLKIP